MAEKKKTDNRPKRKRTDEWIQQQVQKESDLSKASIKAQKEKMHPGGHGKNGTASQAYHIIDTKLDRDYKEVFDRQYKTIVCKRSAGNVNIVLILFKNKRSWNVVKGEFEGCQTRPAHWRQAKHLFKPDKKAYQGKTTAHGDVDATLQAYLDECPLVEKELLEESQKQRETLAESNKIQ